MQVTSTGASTSNTNVEQDPPTGMPGGFPTSQTSAPGGLPVRASGASSTPPRPSVGSIFASVKNYFLGPPAPLPEPAPSLLTWPSATGSTSGAKPEFAIGTLQKDGLPPELKQPRIAGYRGQTGNHGDITGAEIFLQGKGGQLLRLPMMEGANSTSCAVNLASAASIEQLNGPRLGGYEQVPGSQDIVFRVGEHCVKPALGARPRRTRSQPGWGPSPARLPRTLTG